MYARPVDMENQETAASAQGTNEPSTASGEHSSHVDTPDFARALKMLSDEIRYPIGTTIRFHEDATIRAQLEKIHGILELEGTENNPDAVDKTLFEIVNECIPNESPLSAFLGSRFEGRSFADFEAGVKHHAYPQTVWDFVDDPNRSEDVILTIHCINSTWCEFLYKKYPRSISRTFLLEHVLGATLPLVHPPANSRPLTPDDMPSSVPWYEIDSSSDDNFHQALPNRPDNLGFHINCWHESQVGSSMSFSTPFSVMELIKEYTGWTKRNAFVSCCRLTDNLCLLLTSKLPRDARSKAHASYNRTLCISKEVGNRIVVRIPSHGQVDVTAAVTALIRQHWPIFMCISAAEKRTTSRQQSDFEGAIFACLLTATILRLGVEKEEGQMRDVAYSINVEDDAKRFKMLTDLRRDLGRLYHALGESRTAFTVMAHTDLLALKIDIRRDGGSSASAAAPVHQTTTDSTVAGSSKSLHSEDFGKFYQDSLNELQKRIDAIKEDLNEEIQVAIGAVQVEDARIMKEQTRVTVALAVLAAIYLPLTLVTGIFGMNITEISDEKTAPRAWSVVVAWMAVFALSAGGFWIWRSKEKKADLEASERSDKDRDAASDRTRMRLGIRTEERAKGRGWKSWQAIKTRWSRKRE